MVSHKPTAVLSLATNPSVNQPFQNLWNAIGMNTGNLFFTESMFQMLDGEVERIGWVFEPDEVNQRFARVVIPAANWINSYSDWTLLVEKISQLKIPVILVGIGLQADNHDGLDSKVHHSAMELVAVVSRKSNLIGVRGEKTQLWLRGQGIENVVVIGCPSMFLPLPTVPKEGSERIIVQGTKFFSKPGFQELETQQASLYSFAFRNKLNIIYQSEYEEMNHIVSDERISRLPSSQKAGLLEQYQAETIENLENFLDHRGDVFFGVDDWANFVATASGLVGSRIHGAIMALNTGTPAVLLAHDLRVTEMAEFAGITTMSSGDVATLKSKEDANELLKAVDLIGYTSRRNTNSELFRKFLTENQIPFRPAKIFRSTPWQGCKFQ